MARKSNSPATPQELAAGQAAMNAARIPVMRESHHFLSDDLGNGMCNTRCDVPRRDEDGKECPGAYDWRSVMSPLSDVNRMDDYPFEDVMCYLGEWWATGEACYTLAPTMVEELLTVDRYTSAWYKRLFAFSLHKSFNSLVGQEIVYVDVVSSVPAKQFKDKAFTKAVKLNLGGEYHITNINGGVLHVHVNKVTIIPEGIGAYFGYAYSDDPQTRNFFSNGTFMVADFGYQTLDAVFVRDGNYVADLAQSDGNSGASVIASAVTSHVQSMTQVEIQQPQIDMIMNLPSISVNGKTVDLTNVYTSNCSRVGKRSIGLLETWSRGSNLSGVIACGGNYIHLQPYLISRLLPALKASANPQRANVEGAYQFLTWKDE